MDRHAFGCDGCPACEGPTPEMELAEAARLLGDGMRISRVYPDTGHEEWALTREDAARFRAALAKYLAGRSA